ncbi:HypC/HybG/HupF family hydrogenase formation chaperone [Myxococcota bacterium]|nr:HypC/HybG/HupF family hydrogenase formation chaperone [Myxococcota bacterium]MCZ7617784.1 HypC/HybG/HupF family hydrogenase formation chaperone [Myxococcota bacterium]
MCLGVPGQIVGVDGDVAQVDFWGVRRAVRLDVVDEPVAPGDWVLNHVGFAIHRIPPEEVAATLALYDEILRAAEDDAMRADLCDEIEASSRKPDAD